MLYVCKQTIANAGIYFKLCDIENNIKLSFIIKNANSVQLNQNSTLIMFKICPLFARSIAMNVITKKM